MIGLFFTDQTIIFDDTGRTGKGATIQLQFARGLISESFNCISSLTTHIILNTVISPNFLLWTFCERHSFPRVSGDSPKTLRKLCLSAKFPHQEIRWNYGILRSVSFCKCKFEWRISQILLLNHLFPIHPFCTPWKHQKILRFYGFLMFSGGREKGHWEQMG